MDVPLEGRDQKQVVWLHDNISLSFSNREIQKDVQFCFVEWYAGGDFACRIPTYYLQDFPLRHWNSKNKGRLREKTVKSMIPWSAYHWHKFHIANYLEYVLPSKFQNQKDLWIQTGCPSLYILLVYIPMAHNRMEIHQDDNREQNQCNPLESADWLIWGIRDGK